MKRFLLPLIMTFFFVAEGSFVDVVPANLFGTDSMASPRFVMILIVFITVYLNRFQGIVYGIIFGLLYDVVYTEILGVYMFSMPLIAYGVSKLSKILHTNILIVSIYGFLAIVLLEFFLYYVNLLIGYATISIDIFIYLRLFPTLILNSVFILIVSYPFKRLLMKLAIVE